MKIREIIFFISLGFPQFAFAQLVGQQPINTSGIYNQGNNLSNQASGQACIKTETLDEPNIAGKIYDIIQKGTTDLKGCAVNFSDVQATVREMEVARDGCRQAGVGAQSLCIEGCNSNLLSTVSRAGGLMSGLAGASGTESTCKTMNMISELLNGGVTAMAAACATSQTRCKSSCGDVKTKAQAALEAINKLKLPDSPGEQCKDAAKVITQLKPRLSEPINTEMRGSGNTTGALLNQCQQQFSKQLTNAMMSSLQMVGAILNSKSCEQLSTAGTPVNDCTNPANALTQACVCAATPTANGCSPTLAFRPPGSGNNDGFNSGAPTTLPGADGGGGVGFGGDTAFAPGGKGNPGSAPTGFGGTAGAGALAGQGADPKGGAAGTGLNGNILSGERGGSGGGGGYGALGNNEPKAIAARLGVRAPGSFQAPTKVEVTGAGGRDNWQKISERYTQVRGSLLPN